MLRTTAPKMAVAGMGPGASSAAPVAPGMPVAPGHVARQGDSCRLSMLESQLIQLDLKLNATAEHVEKQLAEICSTIAEDRAATSDARLNATGSNEVADLRRQFASLQGAVDGDVLEAFRRLRQQTTDINAKVEQLMAGRISPSHSRTRDVGASASSHATSADTHSLEVRINELETRLLEEKSKHAKLEARISAVLVERLDALGQQVLESEGRVAERLSNVEVCVSELSDKQAHTDTMAANVKAYAAAAQEAAGKAVELVQRVDPMNSQSEKGGSKDFLIDVDKRMTEVGQELLLLMEERFAAVEAQILGHRTEHAGSLKAVREDLIEMTSRIFKSLEERIGISHDPVQKNRDTKIHHVLTKQNDSAAGTDSDNSPGSKSKLGSGVYYGHAEALQPSAEVEALQRTSAKVIDALHGAAKSSERIGSPGFDKHHDGQPAATGSAAAAASMAARDALAALRGRLQEQGGSPGTATAAEDAVVAAITAARSKGAFSPDSSVSSSFTMPSAEDAVVAAIAAARAKGSPASSHRSVASTFSPLAGIDRPGSGTSASPSRFLNCSDILDSGARSVVREQVIAERPVPKFAARYGAQGSGSPQLPRRGRQLPGRPEPSDYQELPVQDSPFRRKNSTRDILPRFGSPALANWVPTAVLRSLREEETESNPGTRAASPASALAAPAASASQRRPSQRSGSGSPKGTWVANFSKGVTRTRTPPRETQVAANHAAQVTANAARPRTPPRQMPEAARGPSPTLRRKGSGGSPGRGASRGAEQAQPNALPLDKRRRNMGGSTGPASPQVESRWRRGSPTGGGRSPTETVTTHG